MKGVFSWKVVLLYSLLIVFFSTIPLTISESLSFPLSDKLFHLLIYFFLSLEVTNTFLISNHKIFILRLKMGNFVKKRVCAQLVGFFYAFFLGLLVEVVQLCLPFRNFEAADILSNVSGSLLGCLVKII